MPKTIEGQAAREAGRRGAAVRYAGQPRRATGKPIPIATLPPNVQRLVLALVDAAREVADLHRDDQEPAAAGEK